MCSSESTQDYRCIFVVDNSGSMSNGEFQQSKATVDASIEYVLDKLAKVEVAVVQYGSDSGPAYDLGKATNHDYDVSVPFTSDPVSATNWNRVYGISGHFQDHTPGSLSKMRRGNVYGSGEALDITDADNVQFVFFTDASRDDSQWGCCSSIVADVFDHLSDTVYPGFGEYDALKSGAVPRWAGGTIYSSQ